jgi:hypothetical protein
VRHAIPHRYLVWQRSSGDEYRTEVSGETVANTAGRVAMPGSRPASQRKIPHLGDIGDVYFLVKRGSFFYMAFLPR